MSFSGSKPTYAANTEINILLSVTSVTAVSEVSALVGVPFGPKLLRVEAVRRGDRRRRNPNFSPARRLLAIVYAELDRKKEARAEVAEILRISPDASLDLWRGRFPYKNKADLDRYISGLQKAGLN